jgi:zinc transport system ATP-binding protein
MSDRNTALEYAVRFEGVYFSYGDYYVLEDLSFEVGEGEFAALAGPNGSGKTTVLKVLLGLEKPRRGSVTVLGGASPRGGIGYVPQQAPFDEAFPIPVEDVVKMGRLLPWSRKRSGEDRAAVKEALERAEIDDIAGRSYAKLSGGQRRRVLVARALASRPRLLVLDEPTANMDADSEDRLLSTLEKLKGKTTILMVTHDIEKLTRLTDKVIPIGRRK